MPFCCVSSYFWRICALKCLPVISYFLEVFSHSLIPSTSRLRINYISIDWPLGGGIDIHGPPSAPGPMCIPQHRSPASCITPGLHYLLKSSVASARECLFGENQSRSSHGGRFLISPSHIYAQMVRMSIRETSNEPKGTEQNLDTQVMRKNTFFIISAGLFYFNV